MNNSIKLMTQEAHQIINNARQALKEQQITEQQFNDVIHNLLLDVGFRAEVITEPVQEGS